MSVDAETSAPEGSTDLLPGIFRTVVDGMDGAVAVTDARGRYRYQNRRHRELLGWSDEEIRDLTPAAHLGEGLFRRIAGALAADGRYDGDVVSTARDGRSVQLRLSAFLISDGAGEPVCYVGITRDPHADVEGGLEGERSIALLRATLEATTDGILEVDLAGRIVRYNRRFVEIWNLPPEVLARRSDAAALDAALPQVVDPDAYRARVQDVYDNPDSTSFDVVSLRDGRVVERHSRPQRVAGRVVGRVWIFRDVTDRHRAESALRESEERYRSLFEESKQPVYLTTREGDFVDVNQAMLDLLGYEREEMLRSNARQLYADPVERGRFQDAVESGGHVEDFLVRLLHRDGDVLECTLTTTVRLDSDGEITGYQGMIHDVTEAVEEERALRASEKYFRSLIEHASDTITILEADGTIRYESPSVERVTGWPPGELVGENIFDLVHPDDQASARRELAALLENPGAAHPLEIRFRHADGGWLTLEAVGRNLLEQTAVRGIVINARDVTHRKEVEERLVHDAFHDRLTGLPNRALFMDRMDKLLKRSRRQGGEGFAVLFLDLDRFKVLNDSLGHMVGDQLLIALAERLEAELRPGDTVARLGGDEFTLLLEGADEEEAQLVADRIRTRLEAPFELGPHEVYTSASVGVATAADEYRRPEDLLRDADLAMYRAKESGRSRVAVFDRSMHDAAMATLHLETNLRRALERGEFELHYQPIVDLVGGRLVGLEALIRWRHPERGLLLPREFLRSATDTGLIVPIGRWVLDEACGQVAAWRSELGDGVPPLHVNVSAHQLVRTDMVASVGDALSDSGVPGSLLHLELTESTMMENAESSIRTLNSLKELDVGLSIDDFGTGYSSLSYLHRFPTDSVKIDRTFVARMGPGGREAGIVRTIVDLAHDLGMRVVAEGVETEPQAETLRHLRCERAQGFLYAAALPAMDVPPLLAEPLLPVAHAATTEARPPRG